MGEMMSPKISPWPFMIPGPGRGLTGEADVMMTIALPSWVTVRGWWVCSTSRRSFWRASGRSVVVMVMVLALVYWPYSNC
jgi:hypothetical protein